MRAWLRFLLAARVLAAQPGMYTIQPAPGNRLALEVEKTGLLSGKKHLFLYERYDGRLEYDPAAPENSRVELTIEAASAVCQDTWVKPKDLPKIQQAALDLTESSRHPALHFVSRAIARQAEREFELSGDLTIRGVTRPVKVAVIIEPGAGPPVFSGRAVIRMKDYGIKPPSAALGMIGTKDEMRFEFRLAAAPAP